MSHPRAGFTLTEVAFSLAIVAVAVITVMLLLASGLRIQQETRYRILAATKAAMLLEQFSQVREDAGANPGARLGLPMSSIGNKPEDEVGILVNGGRIRNSHQFGPAGQFDLERMLGNQLGGAYPVPLSIARRLESPGDEIRRVIDAGGRLYYFDPTMTGGYAKGAAASGSERAASPEAQRLVFAVVGAAQQNLLPQHPWADESRVLYPFPPVTMMKLGNYWNRTDVADSIAIWPRMWSEQKNAKYRGYPAGFTGDLVVQDFALPHGLDGDANSGDTMPNAGSFAGPDSCAWEWGTVLDQRAGDGPWLRGSWEFRRLAHYHWNRYFHQIAPSFVLPRSQSSYTYVVDVPIHEERDQEIVVWRTSRDASMKPIFISEKRTVKVQVQTGTKKELRTGGGGKGPTKTRGIPHAYTGLPHAKGMRGTDILYADHETSSVGRLDQLMIGLPGLQRRIMYRTAALALWARVDVQSPAYSAKQVPMRAHARALHDPDFPDYDPDIFDPHQPNEPRDPFAADPNAIKVDKDPDDLHEDRGTPAGRNPLLEIIDPPEGIRIHPAQILALSYLAHAAMTVTGYKPPFIDTKNSPSPVDPGDAANKQHSDLVPKPENPYREHLMTSTVDVLDEKSAVLDTYIIDHRYALRDPTYVNPASVTGGAAEAKTFIEDGTAGPESENPATPLLLLDVERDESGRKVDNRRALVEGVLFHLNRAGGKYYDPTRVAGWKLDETSPGNHVLAAVDTDKSAIAVGLTGEPIVVRRYGKVLTKTGSDSRPDMGAILNPFPGPYADTKTYDYYGCSPSQLESWRDPRTTTFTIGLPESSSPLDPLMKRRPNARSLRVAIEYRSRHVEHIYRPPPTRPYDPYDPRTPTDTEMAQSAMETCLRWTMAYLAHHPGDRIVPRAINRFTCFDRPLAAFDLFAGSGDQAVALRPQNPVVWGQFYRTLWGDEHTSFRPESVTAQLGMTYWNYKDKAGWKNGGSYVEQNPQQSYANGRGPDHLDPLALLGPLRNPLGTTVRRLDGYPKSIAPHRHTERGRRSQIMPSMISWLRCMNYAQGVAPADATKANDAWPRRSLIGDVPKDAWEPPASARPRWWYTRRFDVSDRCRQLVFWAVDWKSYEDAESAPAAPNDFSQVGLEGLSSGKISSPLWGAGTPEFAHAWTTPARDGTMAKPPLMHTDAFTGRDTRKGFEGADWAVFTNIINVQQKFGASRLFTPWSALGFWGADRNGNGVWDRGTVSTNTRMRAVEVGRFVFYDPVMWTSVRN